MKKIILITLLLIGMVISFISIAQNEYGLTLLSIFAVSLIFAAMENE